MTALQAERGVPQAEVLGALPVGDSAAMRKLVDEIQADMVVAMLNAMQGAATVCAEVCVERMKNLHTQMLRRAHQEAEDSCTPNGAQAARERAMSEGDGTEDGNAELEAMYSNLGMHGIEKEPEHREAQAEIGAGRAFAPPPRPLGADKASNVHEPVLSLSEAESAAAEPAAPAAAEETGMGRPEELPRAEQAEEPLLAERLSDEGAARSELTEAVATSQPAWAAAVGAAEESPEGLVEHEQEALAASCDRNPPSPDQEGTSKSQEAGPEAVQRDLGLPSADAASEPVQAPQPHEDSVVVPLSTPKCEVKSSEQAAETASRMHEAVMPSCNRVTAHVADSLALPGKNGGPAEAPVPALAECGDLAAELACPRSPELAREAADIRNVCSDDLDVESSAQPSHEIESEVDGSAVSESEGPGAAASATSDGDAAAAKLEAAAPEACIREEEIQIPHRAASGPAHGATDAWDLDFDDLGMELAAPSQPDVPLGVEDQTTPSVPPTAEPAEPIQDARKDEIAVEAPSSAEPADTTSEEASAEMANEAGDAQDADTGDFEAESATLPMPAASSSIETESRPAELEREDALEPALAASEPMGWASVAPSLHADGAEETQLAAPAESEAEAASPVLECMASQVTWNGSGWSLSPAHGEPPAQPAAEVCSPGLDELDASADAEAMPVLLETADTAKPERDTCKVEDGLENAASDKIDAEAFVASEASPAGDFAAAPRTPLTRECAATSTGVAAHDAEVSPELPPAAVFEEPALVSCAGPGAGMATEDTALPEAQHVAAAAAAAEDGAVDDSNALMAPSKGPDASGDVAGLPSSAAPLEREVTPPKVEGAESTGCSPSVQSQDFESDSDHAQQTAAQFDALAVSGDAGGHAAAAWDVDGAALDIDVGVDKALEPAADPASHASSAGSPQLRAEETRASGPCSAAVPVPDAAGGTCDTPMATAAEGVPPKASAADTALGGEIDDLFRDLIADKDMEATTAEVKDERPAQDTPAASGSSVPAEPETMAAPADDAWALDFDFEGLAGPGPAPPAAECEQEVLLPARAVDRLPTMRTVASSASPASAGLLSPGVTPAAELGPVRVLDRLPTMRTLPGSSPSSAAPDLSPASELACGTPAAASAVADAAASADAETTSAPAAAATGAVLGVLDDFDFDSLDVPGW